MTSTTDASGRMQAAIMIFMLSAVSYAHRICMSVAMPDIRVELGLSASQAGFVFSAFAVAYGLFEIPWGILGDAYGARMVLCWIVLAWSLALAAEGLATGWAWLLALHFCFGAAQAATFPNASRYLATRFPLTGRGRSLGFAFAGLAVGAATAGPLALLSVRALGWRSTFFMFAVTGLVWALGWRALTARKFESRTSGSPNLSRSERIGVRRSKTVRTQVAICVMYAAYGYGQYFYVTWLPSYLKSDLGLEGNQLLLFTTLPWLMGLLGFATGGVATDWLLTRSSIRVARGAVGGTGMALSGLAVLFATRSDGPLWTALLISLAASFLFMTVPAAWSACIDVGGVHAGRMSGLMNTFGSVGGALAPIVVGYSVEKWNSWRLPLDLSAIVLGAGALIWLLIDPPAREMPEAVLSVR